MVKLHTSHGTIALELFPEKAPETVENFMRYAREGFFDGTVFHRVIPGFMIQGGGMTADLSQKPTHAPIRNEADNGVSNARGTLAMARTSDPNSASSQFFINLSDNTFLDHTAPTSQGWGYCVFGQVTEGMDVVDAISREPTGNRGFHQDVPVKEVLIERVELED